MVKHRLESLCTHSTYSSTWRSFSKIYEEEEEEAGNGAGMENITILVRMFSAAGNSLKCLNEMIYKLMRLYPVEEEGGSSCNMTQGSQHRQDPTGVPPRAHAVALSVCGPVLPALLTAQVASVISAACIRALQNGGGNGENRGGKEKGPPLPVSPY